MSEINSKSLSLLLQVQTAIAYCDAGIESGAVSVKFDEGTVLLTGVCFSSSNHNKILHQNLTISNIMFFSKF